MEPRIGFARNVARDLLGKHGVTAAPIPVREIIQREGFVIEEKAWDSRVSGGYSQKRRAIVVNARHHEHRKRFTIAHELGHIALRHQEMKDTDTSFLHQATARAPDCDEAHLDVEEVRPFKDAYDVEADEFAGELLLPRHLVKKDWPALQNIEKLAAAYDVSKEAAAIAVMRTVKIG